MHVQMSSYPGVIATFIHNVRVLCGLGKGQELIDDIRPWRTAQNQRQAGPYYSIRSLIALLNPTSATGPVPH